jgi:hypothetical protein
MCDYPRLAELFSIMTFLTVSYQDILDSQEEGKLRAGGAADALENGECHGAAIEFRH